MQPIPPRGGSGPLSRLEAILGQDGAARAERIAHIRAQHIINPYDGLIHKAVSEMMEEQLAFLRSQRGPADADAIKKRAIFVIGASGSGKSTAIAREFASRAPFSPTLDGNGINYDGLAMSFVAPKPSVSKLVASTGLRALGYPVSRLGQANELWAILRQQLRELELLWLLIDEMQHVVRSSGSSSVRDMADIVKNVLQILNWPLCCVFSGVTALGAFIHFDDRQLRNRCHVIRFEPIQKGPGTKTMQRIAGGVIRNHAGMTADEEITSETFANCVIHATHGALGTSIDLIRDALFNALRQGREHVTRSDFAAAYHSWTGCLHDQNVFLADDYESIDPDNAVKDCLLHHESEGRKLRELTQGTRK